MFTDIDGSTGLWEAAPEEMRAALARHDAAVRGAIEAHGGYLFATGGDGFGPAFGRAHDALAAAGDAQAGLGSEGLPDGAVLRVRMGLHTGARSARFYVGAAGASCLPWATDHYTAAGGGGSAQ